MTGEVPVIPVPLDMDADDDDEPDTGEGHPEPERDDDDGFNDAKAFTETIFSKKGTPEEPEPAGALAPRPQADGMLAIPRPSDLRALSADRFSELNGQVNDFDAQYRRFRKGMQLEYRRRAIEDKLREARHKREQAESFAAKLIEEERRLQELLLDAETKLEELENE